MVEAGANGKAPDVGDDGHTHESACLNCGAALAGAYCSACGQHAHVPRTLGAWWHDFQHSVLHLDGKALKTLPLLAWKPGELTRRYARGERRKFVSPLALFLFTVFLMFAVFSIAGPKMGDVGNVTVAEGLKEEQATLRRLETERARAGDAAEQRDIDEDIAKTRRDIATLERLRNQGVASASFEEGDPGEVPAFFANAYRKAKQNPELLVYKLQANAYKFSWALIPISIPFLWVLFLHRRRYRADYGAYDHLVFVTYSIAFMSLTLVAVVLLGMLGVLGGGLNALLLLVPPVHMYRQLRGAYCLSRFSAAWRTLALLIFSGLALGLFAALLLLLGVAG